MKKKNFILLLLSVVLAFPACSDDNDEPDVVKPEMKYKQVKKIVMDEGYGPKKTTVFNYDSEGRITEEIVNGEIFTFTYGNGQIVMESAPDFKETFVLDKEGKVLEIKYRADYDQTESSYSYSGGYLQKITEKDAVPEEDEVYTVVESYSWNGYLVRTSYSDGETSSETKYEYGDLKYVNNANIDLFSYLGDFYSNVEDALKLGCAGERSWYLPTGYTTIEKEEGAEDSYSAHLSYMLDTEGYVTKITVTYEDEEETPLIYEITYTD